MLNAENVSASVSDQPESGEWILISTFREPTAQNQAVIAYGKDPVSQPGDDGFQSLRRLKYPDALIKKLITDPVSLAARTKRPGRESMTVRGKSLYSVTEPVPSGTDNVHAVWVWIGQAKIPAEKHVLTGAWEWFLHDTSSFHVIYGANIPEIYGSDWEIGKPYPLHRTVDAISVEGMSEVAQILSSGPDGTRYAMKATVRRPQTSTTNEWASIRAATEIVETAAGRSWRGVTLDVTKFLRPNLDPQRAATSRLAHDAPGWTATIYWTPERVPSSNPDRFLIQVARWEGEKVVPGLWSDPVTGRGRVHPEQRGLPHQWALKLAHVNELEEDLRLWGTDGRWHELHVRIERIIGSNPPGATVRITARGGDRS